jgi:recombinational DNA repair protein (RecF pathway)
MIVMNKIACSCYVCKKKLHQKHFTAEDGRILCYKCRTKEKAMPANNRSFKSVLGIKEGSNA